MFVSVLGTVCVPFGMLGAYEFGRSDYFLSAIFLGVAMISEYLYIYFKPYWEHA
jgi:hypothetical protein